MSGAGVGGVALDRATLAYGGAPVVTALSGRFPAGSLTAVLGENGAGKTTLLRAIAGLHPLAAGRIDLGGLPRAAVGLLPQASTLDRSFPLTCFELTLLGLAGRAGPWRAFAAGERARAAAALDAVGLASLGARRIGALSAGQFQRLLFARLLAQDARLLLLDEPFAGVDEATQATLLDAIGRLHADGRTVVCVLHDRALAERRFPRRLTLTRGGGVWSEPAPDARAAA